MLKTGEEGNGGKLFHAPKSTDGWVEQKGNPIAVKKKRGDVDGDERERGNNNNKITYKSINHIHGTPNGTVGRTSGNVANILLIFSRSHSPAVKQNK